MPFLNFIRTRLKSSDFMVILGLTFILGLLGCLTGPEISLAGFFLLPIALAAWHLDGHTACFEAMLCGALLLTTDLLSRHAFASPSVPYWNAAIRSATFVMVALTVSRLRHTLKTEKQLSRVDFLTGAANYRAFYAFAKKEIYRSQRQLQPLTVVMIDCDNFKQVNDTLGHEAGNEVLRTTVQVIQNHIRQTDLVARMGGDEFGILITESGPKATELVLSRLRKSLLSEMRRNDWPVTFSIGAATFLTAPTGVKVIENKADELMYSVKRAGKNALSYEIVEGENQESTTS